jgi:hypothetical protein
MKTYYLIKDGVVVGNAQLLPDNFNNISNFNCLSDLELASFGWLPVEYCSTPGEIFVSKEVVVLEDRVIQTVNNRDKTDEERLAEISKTKATKLEELRIKRNIALQLSDMYMLVDNWNKLTPENQAKLIVYRQTLRDLPDMGVDIVDLVFPEFPL